MHVFVLTFALSMFGVLISTIAVERDGVQEIEIDREQIPLVQIKSIDAGNLQNCRCGLIYVLITILSIILIF